MKKKNAYKKYFILWGILFAVAIISLVVFRTMGKAVLIKYVSIPALIIAMVVAVIGYFKKDAAGEFVKKDKNMADETFPHL